MSSPSTLRLGTRGSLLARAQSHLVMRALKASRLDILTNVGLPRTMPYFFAS